MPDEITLRDEAGALRACREVGPDELVPAVLIRIAHDDDRVAARLQYARQLPERPLDRVEEGWVVGRVGQVGRDR